MAFGEVTTGSPARRYFTHLHEDILSHLLGYLNIGRNPSAGIELKTCFLLYIHTYIYIYIEREIDR